jgi:hypothetical protein
VGVSESPILTRLFFRILGKPNVGFSVWLNPTRVVKFLSLPRFLELPYNFGRPKNILFLFKGLNSRRGAGPGEIRWLGFPINWALIRDY